MRAQICDVARVAPTLPCLPQLKRFAEDHKAELGTATRQVMQSIEQAEANIAWMDKNFDTIVWWLGNATAAAAAS